MGRRTNLRLAQSKPPLGQGFRGFDRQRQSLGLHRLRAAARQATVLPIAQPIRLRFGHLVRLSTPKCAFMPKYHWFPFFVCCISGSLAFSSFMVEDVSLM